MSSCFNPLSLKQLTVDYVCSEFSSAVLSESHHIISELMFKALIHRKVVLSKIARERADVEDDSDSEASFVFDDSAEEEEVPILHRVMFKKCNLNDIRGSGFQKKIEQHHPDDIPLFTFVMNKVFTQYFEIDGEKYCGKCAYFYRTTSENNRFYRGGVELIPIYEILAKCIQNYVGSYCQLCENQLFCISQSDIE